jgi:hypothetical protein
MDFDTLRNDIDEMNNRIMAELDAEISDFVEWYRLVERIGKIVGLPSSKFPKGNEHIVEKIQELVDAKNRYTDDGK